MICEIMTGALLQYVLRNSVGSTCESVRSGVGLLMAQPFATQIV